MIVWCHLCNTNPVEMGSDNGVEHPRDFPHTFSRPLCLECEIQTFGGRRTGIGIPMAVTDEALTDQVNPVEKLVSFAGRIQGPWPYGPHGPTVR